jgi:hypothetical protein
MSEFYHSSDDYVDYLDLNVNTTTAINGRYTTPINAIYNRHTTDIRAIAAETIPIGQTQNRKRLKELVNKHSNDLFSFIHSDGSASSNFAETIFRKYGIESTPVNRPYVTGSITREFGLDISMNEVLNEMNVEFKKMYDVSGTASHVDSQSIQSFLYGMRWIINEYRVAGDEVSRLESLLNQRLGNLDKIHKKINALQQLPENDAIDALYEAFQAYTECAFKDANIEDTYKDLVTAYKRWSLLREIIAVQQMFEPKPAEPQCSICITDSVSHAVSPCGHTFCTNCIKKMNTSCYICRGSIRDRIRLFLG